MNRRRFIQVLFVAGLATVVPIRLSRALRTKLPMIYGDGLHDDAPGINAALRGQEFIANQECCEVIDGTVHLKNRPFALRGPIDMTFLRQSA